MSLPSLDTLPTELLYYLFKYLDVTTILFAFRYVCKRFQTIVNTYDQYKLDLRLISKVDFDHICHVLSPKEIVSIILSNNFHTPHQIRMFLSRFSLDQFSRLQSLELIKIEENNLYTILMHITKCQLKSLSIICSSWNTFSYTVRILLSSTITNSNLEKLQINISYRDLDMNSWPPLPITLKSLRLEHCTFQEYCMILRYTINLQQLTLTECRMHNPDNSIYQPLDIINPSKLQSLSLGACFMCMKELFIFLTCTPRLKHLKLILWTDSSDSVINGKKWEEFISEKLPLLNQFEFFFDDLTHVSRNSLNIQSFQTSFWLEKHQWYVTYDYINSLSVIRLYSLPICNPSFTYYSNSKKISYSTLPIKDTQIQLVHEMSMDLNDTIETDNDRQESQSTNPIFYKINCLSLNLDGRYPYTSIQYLRRMIDLSSLVRLTIQLLIPSSLDSSILNTYISSILKDTSNIHTLKLTYIHLDEPFANTANLCPTIPHSVKHLKTSVTNFEEIQNILERLPQLSSVTFYSEKISTYYEDIQLWIQQNRRNSLYRKEEHCIQIWLGNLSINNHAKNTRKRVLDRFRRRRSR